MSKFNLKKLIQFRRDMHEYPEISYEEFETRKKIKKILLESGIEENKFRFLAKTGMIVDIYGKGPKEGKDFLIGFRADMDALETYEGNLDLQYRSKQKKAHLCGHDGHVTCLIGDQIPCNRGIRALFQPAEEIYGGAKEMVDEGAIEGVKEVWGLHNMPWDPIDQILVKEGLMMYGAEQLFITIKGQGGHSSLKYELKDPVYPACYMIVQFEKFLENLSDEERSKVIASFPKVQGSTVSNIISEQSQLEGVIRFKDKQIHTKCRNYIDKLKKEIEDKFKVEISINSNFYPVTENDSKMVEILNEIIPNAKNERIPVKASEDFNNFARGIPTCFFFYCIGTKSGKTLHDKDYNFNDDCIENMSKNWLKIMLARTKEDKQIQKFK